MILQETAGGGGFGDPFQRPPEEVGRDVALGYVSVEAAFEHYGVVVDEAGNVDHDATARRRGQRR